MNGTEFHDVTITIEDDKEDKIVAPVEIAMNKAVIEVDVRVNAEETHDESDKGTVGEAQEASVALVEDWSTMLQLTWSPRGRRAVCLVSTCFYQDQD